MDEEGLLATRDVPIQHYVGNQNGFLAYIGVATVVGGMVSDYVWLDESGGNCNISVFIGKYTLQLISGAFEHSVLSIIWFVWPIDCNVKHRIFQSINFPYTQHRMFKRSRSQLYVLVVLTVVNHSHLLLST